MDYQGQKLSEYLYYFLIIIFGIVAWIYGYIVQDFQQTVYGLGIGLGLSILICVPDWPFYNRHKVIWADEVSLLSQKSKSSKSKKSSKRDD